jgi:hypothetical protein
VKYVADQAGLLTMLVTGIYREPFMPDWVFDASVDDRAWLLEAQGRRWRHGRSGPSSCRTTPA